MKKIKLVIILLITSLITLGCSPNIDGVYKNINEKSKIETTLEIKGEDVKFKTKSPIINLD